MKNFILSASLLSLGLGAVACESPEELASEDVAALEEGAELPAGDEESTGDYAASTGQDTDPTDNADAYPGSDKLAGDNVSEYPNPFNTRFTISPASTCLDNSDCSAGERCDPAPSNGELNVKQCVAQCDVREDCQVGESCGSDGYCDVLARGNWSLCSNGGCNVRGDGDCDAGQCEGGLTCFEGNGAAWGLPSGQEACDYPAGHYSYCSTAHPCAWGQGDCDEYQPAQCGFGLVCKSDRGGEFGWASNVDVCMWPWD